MIAQPTTTPLGFTHPDDVSHILYAVRDIRALAARADALSYPLHARYLESAARFLRAGAAIWLDNAAGGDE